MVMRVPSLSPFLLTPTLVNTHLHWSHALRRSIAAGGGVQRYVTVCCAVTCSSLQVQSKDKDFRYMATSDLLAELSKDTFHVDAEMEKRLCGVVAVQLEDQSADISALALRW
jgi:hypothetical protein